MNELFKELEYKSLIEEVEEYIEKGNITHLSLTADYKEYEIISLENRYEAKLIIKGFNYFIWSLAKSSKDLEEFYLKVESKLPGKEKHFKEVANTRDVTTLEEFIERLIYKPKKFNLIKADNISELREIAKSCNLLQRQIKLNPEMKNKRKIQKICNLRDSKEKIGIGIGENY